MTLLSVWPSSASSVKSQSKSTSTVCNGHLNSHFTEAVKRRAWGAWAFSLKPFSYIHWGKMFAGTGLVMEFCTHMSKTTHTCRHRYRYGLLAATLQLYRSAPCYNMPWSNMVTMKFKVGHGQGHGQNIWFCWCGRRPTVITWLVAANSAVYIRDERSHSTITSLPHRSSWPLIMNFPNYWWKANILSFYSPRWYRETRRLSISMDTLCYVRHFRSSWRPLYNTQRSWGELRNHRNFQSWKHILLSAFG